MLVALYSRIHDKVVSDRRVTDLRRKKLDELSSELSNIIAPLRRSVRMTSKDYAEEIKDARRKVLECIRKVTEIHVSDYTGTKLDATVLLFEDEECKKTKVAYRATNKRAAGRVVPSEELMAFHLARTGRHIVVNDFLNGHPFPKESLAGGKPWYRSILMIPLLDASNSEAQLCYGILCIDSSQPFHFWPGGG